MLSFADLKRNLKKDLSNLTQVKIALLGDSATQLLTLAIKGACYEKGLYADIFEGDFNQVELQVLDSNSELYKFDPQVIIIFQSSHKLLLKYNKLSPDQFANLASDQIVLIDQLFAFINRQHNTNVIYYNYQEIDDNVFGNYSNKVETSFLFQLRKLNHELMLYATKHKNFHICDLSSIQNQVGRQNMFHALTYTSADMVLSVDALPFVAFRTADLISAQYGKFKKCLIIDLDNTMWGGIIGDDGLEKIQLGTLGIGKAFTELQYWFKKLKNRGIILAVCSKNTDFVAKEPFEKHPDMVLGLDDISIFIANWDNKVDNIFKIQKVLNIGFDSMVFLDDNPFERAMVRDNIPAITVPELPEDPAEYLNYLYTLNLFETVSYSEEDKVRAKLYQSEEQRAKEQIHFINEYDFLKSLDMVSEVRSFNKFNTPRVAQLSQRSNQFNLRTIRYTETDVERLSDDNKTFTFSFTLKDKFGDNGLIAIVILCVENVTTLFIETWLMSCRVLKRGMEKFVLNSAVELAVSKGFTYLKGEYIPSAKNGMVEHHYRDLGFNFENGYWLLNLKNYQFKDVCIKRN